MCTIHWQVEELEEPMINDNPAAAHEEMSVDSWKVCSLHWMIWGKYIELIQIKVLVFSLQSASIHSIEGERINRVRDDAGDEHLAHVSCPSHRCRIPTDRSVTLLAVAFAVIAVLTWVDVASAAGSEDSWTSLGFLQQPLNIHLFSLLFLLKHFKLWL